MKLVKQILSSAAATRRGLLRTWATVCSGFFGTVADMYPHLVKANLEDFALPTLDLIERGETDDPSITKPQYPRLPLDELSDPAFKALYEVGAVQIHASGDPVVEPAPAVLLRGLARLALPRKFLLGIVNATRISRGLEGLSETEFDALDQEMFAALRRGLSRTLGDGWFMMLNRGSSLLHGAMILPCTRLPRSQEFYEEGIKFYCNQGADSEVFIFSTTSGLVVPREFTGDASKNHYRYQYFIKGILGRTSCNRIYQWERYRTAKELARGYKKCASNEAKAKYRNDAYKTLSRFSKAPNLAIYEVDHFTPWKEWFTLVGPQKQQLSIRGENKKGKIGHGIAFDASSFRKRADFFRDLARVLGAAGVSTVAFSGPSFLKNYGPAFAVAAASSLILSSAAERVGQVLREPVLKKCRNDRETKDVRLVKDLRAVLHKSQVVETIDGLLENGLRILELEAKQ